MDMAEGEVAALKEALFNQYIIMKNLYDELEEERDASATAVSEALSMILRLQREKAAEKMEACQYKRIAEEKIHHVEESLATLEELMQQKDMEIALLKYQLQDCKHILLSIGVNSYGSGETRSYKNPSFSGSNTSVDKTSSHCCIRRNVSLPSLQLDQLKDEMDLIDDDNLLVRQSIWKKIGDYTNQLSEKCEHTIRTNLYEESVKQAEEVNKKVKVFMLAKNDEEKAGYESAPTGNGFQSSAASNDPSYMEEESSLCSWHSAVSSYISYDSIISGIGTKLDAEGVSRFPSQVEISDNIPECDVLTSLRLKAESNGSTAPSVCVHDIFEVPESRTSCSPVEPYKKVLEEPALGTKNMIKMPDIMPQEAIDYLFSDDNWLNMQFINPYSGSKLPKPRKRHSVSHGNKLPRPRKWDNVEYNWNIVEPEYGITTSQTYIEQLRRRLQKFEDGRFMKQEGSEKDKEELRLLQEIYKQLSSIETHLKYSSKNFPPQDESSLVSVMEAVLSFSI